jgi:hypothetical protein
VSTESVAYAPKWMMLTGTDSEIKDDARDFREEIINHIKKNGKLTLNINVANRESFGKKNWMTIGKITFEETFLTEECDHRLHFSHPRFK